MKNFLRKYSFIFEIPLFYLFLVAINEVFFPESPAYMGIDPHPYWLGIVLFAFRYGLLPGFVSGFISAVLYLSFVWIFGEKYIFEDLSFYLLPSFFILVGSMIGFGTFRNNKKVSFMQDEKRRLLEDIRLLKDELATYREINSGLEKKIATSITSLMTLYEGARKLETSDINQLYQAILEFIAKTLDASEIALYLRTPDGWELKTQIGWKDYQKRPQQLRLNEGITGLAGFKGRVVTAREILADAQAKNEMPKLIGDALLAGPIKKGENGAVVGVVAIQDMPFLKLTSTTTNLFSFLLDWSSRSVGRTGVIEEFKANEIIDNYYSVYSERYLKTRLSQEFERSKTYYLPLGLALIKLEGLSRLSPRKRETILMLLSRYLQKKTRPIDVVGCWNTLDTPFAVLFITSSPQQVEEQVKNIMTDFKELLPSDSQVQLMAQVSHFSPKQTSFEEMISQTSSQQNQKGEGLPLAP